VNVRLWLLGTYLGALQCWTGGGEAGKVRKGLGCCQLFGFGRNQPHQHLLLGSGMGRAGQEGRTLGSEPGSGALGGSSSRAAVPGPGSSCWERTGAATSEG